MARVRVLPAIVHTSYGHQPGDEVDLPGDVAQTWCNAGLAELVRGEKVETPEAAAAASETAESKPRPGRARKSS